MQHSLNQQEFEKKFINLCPCLHLDIDLKAVFSRYIRAFGELRGNKKNFEIKQFNWSVSVDSSISFPQENKQEITRILSQIRNYNAHYFYNEKVFTSEYNIVQLLPANYLKNNKFQALNHFFENLITKIQQRDLSLCQKKQCLSQNEIYFAKWIYFFFSVSVVLYKAEYQKLKEQILKTLEKNQKHNPNDKSFTECLDIFQKNVNYFEKEIGIRILEHPLPFKSKDLLILNEMRFLVQNTQQVFKSFEENAGNLDNFEFKTKLSLLKMVKILESILSFKHHQEPDFEVKFKIKSKLYCDNCCSDDEQTEIPKLTEKQKTNKDFLPTHCFQCKRYFNEQNQDANWYLTTPTYSIIKNLWKFHILSKNKDNPKPETVITISKKALQKLFLLIFYDAVEKDKKNMDLINFFQEQMWSFFRTLFYENNDFEIEKNFINQILNNEADLTQFLKKLKPTFKNKDYIKKYQYLGSENQFLPFEWKDKYKIFQFFQDRKQKRLIKLQNFLNNLEKFQESPTFLFSSFEELFTKFSTNRLKVSEIFRIRLKFILQTLNSSFFDTKLKAKHFDNLFAEFFQAIFLQKTNVFLWKILQNLKWSSYDEKNAFNNQVKIAKEEFEDFCGKKEGWDQIYFWLLKKKIKLLKNEINLNDTKTQKKDMKNFYFSILKLNKENEKNRRNIKVNDYWFKTYFPEKPFLNDILKNPKINSVVKDHLESFLLAIKFKNSDTWNKKFLDYLSDKKFFDNKCEVLLRIFLHQLFEVYLLSFGSGDDIRVYKPDLLNFVNSSIAFRIKDKQNNYYDIVFENIQKTKIDYLQIYNLFTTEKIKTFIDLHKELAQKIQDKTIFFKDLSDYVDKVNFNYHNKKITFYSWRIIKSILFKEREEYQALVSAQKEGIGEFFNNKGYIPFRELFPEKNNHQLIKLRNHSMHLDSLNDSDKKTVETLFPKLLQKIARKYKPKK